MALHQVGYAYNDGTFDRLRRRTSAAAGVGILGVAAVLAAAGAYPASMIGLPGAPTSNMNPPTLCLLIFGLGQVALVMALKPTLASFTARARPAAVLRWAVPRTMTIYLWHMPSLVVVAAASVLGLGLRTPAPGSLLWCLGVPLWLLAAALTLYALVRVMSRYERPTDLVSPAAPTRARTAAAVVLCGGGLLGITILGFGAPLWSLTAVAALACGLAVISGSPHPSSQSDQPGASVSRRLRRTPAPS